MKDFECLHCGFCCKLEVTLDRDDIKRIRNAGQRHFYRKKQNEFFLRKRGKYCVFYSDKCRIYDARPRICRMFPFKTEVMSENCTQRKDFYAEVNRKIMKFMLEEGPVKPHRFRH